MEEKLINFLKQKKVYNRFMRNLKDEALKEALELAEKAKEMRFPVNVIGTAFIWDKTPEGDAYWKRVSDEWELLTKL